jgi:hypothetical protein
MRTCLFGETYSPPLISRHNLFTIFCAEMPSLCRYRHVVVAHNRSSTSFKAAPKVVVMVVVVVVVVVVMVVVVVVVVMVLVVVLVAAAAVVVVVMLLIMMILMQCHQIPPELRGALEFSPKMGFVQGGESFNFQIKFEPTQQLLQQCKK